MPAVPKQMIVSAQLINTERSQWLCTHVHMIWENLGRTGKAPWDAEVPCCGFSQERMCKDTHFAESELTLVVPRLVLSWGNHFCSGRIILNLCTFGVSPDSSRRN